MAKVEEPKVEKKQNPKAVVSVDGVDYKYEDLSDNQKVMFAHMQDLAKFKDLFVESLKDEKENKEDANN